MVITTITGDGDSGVTSGALAVANDDDDDDDDDNDNDDDGSCLLWLQWGGDNHH